MATISSAVANGAQPDPVSRIEGAQNELDHLYAWIAGMVAVSALVIVVTFVSLGVFTFPSLGSVARSFIAMNFAGVKVLGLRLA